MDLREIETWLQGRPKWLQDAARRIATNDILLDTDFIELLEICKAEAAAPEGAIPFAGLPSGALAVADVTRDLRLRSISKVIGVNALSATKPLGFGKSDICVVYGGNGSGKSGYVRLLKHACGVRNPGELLGDVFAPAADPQRATFEIVAGGEGRSVEWAGTPLAELNGVDIGVLHLARVSGE